MSTNRAMAPFFLPNIFDAPSDVKEIKFHKRYSCVNPHLCEHLNMKSKIEESEILFSSTKLQKILVSQESGNNYNTDNKSVFLACSSGFINHCSCAMECVHGGHSGLHGGSVARYLFPSPSFDCRHGEGGAAKFQKGSQGLFVGNPHTLSLWLLFV
jgi:hypothetical protein